MTVAVAVAVAVDVAVDVDVAVAGTAQVPSGPSFCGVDDGEGDVNGDGNGNVYEGRSNLTATSS